MQKIFTSCIFLFLFAVTLSLSKGQTNTIDSLTTLLKAEKADTNKINNLNDLCWEYITIGQFDSALFYGNAALQLSTLMVNDVKNPAIKPAIEKGISLAYRRMGIIYKERGDYPRALEYYFKALKIDEELGNKNGIAKNLNNIGNIYLDEGDYERALEYYFKALKINKELGNKKEIANNLSNIGIAYRNQDDYPKALEYYFKALKINGELGNKNGIATNLNNVGNVYYYQGDALPNLIQRDALFSKAVEHFFKALKIDEEIGNKRGIAINLGSIGEVYFKQKKYKDSEEYLLMALNIFTEILAIDFIKEIEEILSDLYSQTNRYQLAYEHYKLFTAAKDSLFNEDKSKEIGRLEMQHEIEIAEMERERKAAEELKIKTQKTERRNLLEYSGMVIGLIIIGLLVTLLGFVKVKPWVAEGITFFVFLLLFEFIIVLLDPYMDKFTKGEPAYKLLINALVAACIFPLHAFFEKMLKRKLMKKK